METNLKDRTRTSFVVVTVPTKLAVDESKRLVTELKGQGIAVDNIVVNQCLGKTEGMLCLLFFVVICVNMYLWFVWHSPHDDFYSDCVAAFLISTQTAQAKLFRIIIIEDGTVK